MDVAHGQLPQTYTTTPLSIHLPPPNASEPLPSKQTQSHASSHSSSYSHGYRSSDSTQATSHSTLFAPPTPASTPLNGGPVEASDNVINKVADKDTSLFQMCVNLRRRLEGLPEFQEQLEEEEEVSDADTDPVTLLWRIFRRGYPLMTIYNALRPVQPLSIDPSRVTEKKRAQAGTFKFLQACVNILKFPPEECFIVTDLYGDDTTGFVKVVKVVNRVLDVLVQEGILPPSNINGGLPSTEPSAKRTQRQHIVAELVNTERTYVQHLEILQSFKKLVEEKGIVSGDTIHDIFLNLNALLDFQRRFLIRVEQTNAQPEAEQDWGKLFILYREAFKVYEPYIANQKRCEETAMRLFDKLREAGGPPELRQIVETPSILGSFLLRPFQRLAKYPLLLKELRDKGDLDEERKANISEAMEVASAVLQRTNAEVDRAERLEAVDELKARVDDWKGHKIELFGELLLHGSFVVLKGEGGKESEVRQIFNDIDLQDRTRYETFGPGAGGSSAWLSSVPPGLQANAAVHKFRPTAPQSRPFELWQDPESDNILDRWQEPMGGSQSLVSPKKTLGLLNGEYIPSVERLRQNNGYPEDPLARECSSLLRTRNKLNCRTQASLAFSHDNKENENIIFPRRHFSPSSILKTLRDFKSPGHGKRQAENEIMSKGTVMHENPSEVYSSCATLRLYTNANLMGFFRPPVSQYRIYLFETILLCCKDINPLKQKNKMMMGKPLVDRRGKPRMQLKGRIFMQNVTEVISLSKPGSYMCQIFWRGDSVIENFIIRFTTEEAMKKWRAEIENQRLISRDIVRASASTRNTGTSETEFISLKDQMMENPYQQDEDADDDDIDTVMPGYGGQSDFELSRNGSSASLRSRSTTGDSGPPGIRIVHPKPPGFDLPALTLRTQHLQNAGMSPGDRFGESYFSPSIDSPMSSRTSSSSGMFPFPRQPTPQTSWLGDEHGNARFTAPAVTRTAPRDQSNGTAPSRVYLQGTAGSTQRLAISQNRLRSASSPDVQNALNRRLMNGNAPPVPDIPVPPFPTHIAHVPNLVSRSQTKSSNNATPRAAPVSPPRQAQPRYAAQYTSTSRDPTLVPAPERHTLHTLSTPSNHTNDTPAPTQLKIKVKVPSEGSSMTLVVSTNISYQSLKDRIDAKLQRHTNLALGAGNVKLKYMDDEDFVSIQSDEDVQTAFELWREQQRDQIGASGQMGEIRLFCQQ